MYSDRSRLNYFIDILIMIDYKYHADGSFVTRAIQYEVKVLRISFPLFQVHKCKHQKCVRNIIGKNDSKHIHISKQCLQAAALHADE